MAEIKTVGILTSGGDAPGMNAAIRAVTRSAIYCGLNVKGIYRGYRGLIADEIVDFHTQNVSNIIQKLPVARSFRLRKAVSWPTMSCSGIRLTPWW